MNWKPRSWVVVTVFSASSAAGVALSAVRKGWSLVDLFRDPGRPPPTGGTPPFVAAPPGPLPAPPLAAPPVMLPLTPAGDVPAEPPLLAPATSPAGFGAELALQAADAAAIASKNAPETEKSCEA